MQMSVENQKVDSISRQISPVRSTILICVEGFCDNIPFGQFTYFGKDRITTTYNGFTDLILKADSLIDQANGSGTANSIRSASNCKGIKTQKSNASACVRQEKSDCKTKKSFIKIQILYRQHTSWQGLIYSSSINENGIPFRSVFELLHLMSELLNVLPKHNAS